MTVVSIHLQEKGFASISSPDGTLALGYLLWDFYILKPVKKQSSVKRTK